MKSSQPRYIFTKNCFYRLLYVIYKFPFRESWLLYNADFKRPVTFIDIEHILFMGHQQESHSSGQQKHLQETINLSP